MRKKSLKKFLSEMKTIDDERLIVCNDGIQIVGYGPEVLTMFSLLVRELNQNCDTIDKEDLEFAFNLGLKSDLEITKMAKEKVSELMKQLEKADKNLSKIESEQDDNE